ncbi:MAG: 6-carboxytetrahydropterin synthase [Bacteroidetes bacterium]|nr:6-carboxytetrahydropterin synthase [Bacteroidota bacterium]
MISLTKIFHFEMAHAIDNFPGVCQYIHGHSYKLHVTFSSKHDIEKYVKSPGYIVNFEELKEIIKAEIISNFDHKLLLSKNYLKTNPEFSNHGNLIVWDAEPTLENLLVYIRKKLKNKLPQGVVLSGLKIFETDETFAEWKL